jgi:predicted transcriptional regulator
MVVVDVLKDGLLMTSAPSKQASAPALPKLTVYMRAIFQKLCELYSMTRNFVRTSVLAGHVTKNDRSVRETLVWLERNGYVKRKGQRGGWMPIVKLDVSAIRTSWTPAARPALAAA